MFSLKFAPARCCGINVQAKHLSSLTQLQRRPTGPA